MEKYIMFIVIVYSGPAIVNVIECSDADKLYNVASEWQDAGYKVRIEGI